MNRRMPRILSIFCILTNIRSLQPNAFAHVSWCPIAKLIPLPHLGLVKLLVQTAAWVHQPPLLSAHGTGIYPDRMRLTARWSLGQKEDMCICPVHQACRQVSVLCEIFVLSIVALKSCSNMKSSAVLTE